MLPYPLTEKIGQQSLLETKQLSSSLPPSSPDLVLSQHLAKMPE